MASFPEMVFEVVREAKPRRYRKTCQVIELTAKIALNQRRSQAERVRELSNLKDCIESLIERVQLEVTQVVMKEKES